MTVDKWEGRQLCEDGACTGVIGQDGTCKTCGKPAPNFGDFRKPGRVSSKSEVDEVEDESSEPVASPAKVAAKADKVAAWNERKLCSDGACVGVIGASGKCKVCGKAADGSEPDDEDEDEDDDFEDEVAAEDSADEEDDDDEESEDDGDDEDDEDEVAQDDEDEDDDEEEDEEDGDDDDEGDDGAERKLCVDGACVGVIGDNGKCKVCGKAAA